MRDAVMAGQALFQPSEGTVRGQFERAGWTSVDTHDPSSPDALAPGIGSRGVASFRPGSKPLITLFRSANPSTALHELAHSWLEELRRDAERADAPQQLKDDWAYIRKWAGIT
ncbi:MAG: hypothetical protein VW362_06840, partial [Candidatus Nanopelagicales bacterium]